MGVGCHSWPRTAPHDLQGLRCVCQARVSDSRCVSLGLIYTQSLCRSLGLQQFLWDPGAVFACVVPVFSGVSPQSLRILAPPQSSAICAVSHSS